MHYSTSIMVLAHANKKASFVACAAGGAARAHGGVKVCSGGGCFSESEFEGSELPGTRSEVNAI